MLTYKEDFATLMINANLSDMEFIILAKRLGLDDKPIETKTLAKMFGLSESLVNAIDKRALYKVKTKAEDQGEFEFLYAKINE